LTALLVPRRRRRLQRLQCSASYQRRVIGLSEEWEWFHASALGLLWLFSHPEERHEFPGSATVTIQTSHHQRPMCPNRLLGPCSIAHRPASSPQLRAPRLIRLSDQFSFADTRSHGPTTLAHKSIAPTGPLEHPHYLWRSRTDMYVLPSFVSQLTNCGRYNTVGFLLLFSIFQWRFEFTLRLHRRYALTSTWIRYHDCSLPSKHRPLSTLLSVYGGRQGQ